MREYNIYEWLEDFTNDGETKSGDKILLKINDKELCTIEVQMDDEDIEFIIR